MSSLQGAGAGELAFGEEADDVALAEGVGGDADGFARFARVAIGTVLKSLQNQRMAGFSMKTASITKRTGRGLAAVRKKASAQVTWFGSSSTPPFFGRLLRVDSADAVEGARSWSGR